MSRVVYLATKEDTCGDINCVLRYVTIAADSMNWIVKSKVQRVLSHFPAEVADPVYHMLQNLRGLRANIQGHTKFLRKVVADLTKLHQLNLHGLTVVEIGSGWYPITPLLLLGMGAAKVHTFDINSHYSSRRIAEAARALLESQCEIANRAQLHQIAETGRLPDEISYHPSSRIEEVNHLDGGAADLCISRFVLEHVQPDTILRIHQSSTKWMRPGGIFVHWVSPSDHRAHSDEKISYIDFLRYSREEWDRLSGNRYAYHNRLRRCQYRSLFELSGLNIEHEKCEILERDLSSLATLEVHEEFANMPPEELVAGSLWFVLGFHSADSAVVSNSLQADPQNEAEQTISI